MNLKLEKAFPRPAIVPPNTEPVLGRVSRLTERKLHVTVSATAVSGRVALYEGHELIGIAQRADAEAEPDWRSRDIELEFILPRFLYDGSVHHLRVVVEGQEEIAIENSELWFLGDPAIVSPVAPLSRNSPELVPSPAPEKLANTGPGDSTFPAIIENLTAALNRIVASLPLAERIETVESRPIVSTHPSALVDRYGPYFNDARIPRGSGPDIVWLGVIDWHYRIQRPQHLATRLADLGSRVFYVSIVFEAADQQGRFRIVSSPHLGIFEIRLRLAGPLPENIYGGFTNSQVTELQLALDELCASLTLSAPALVLEYPSWYPVAAGMPGSVIVHDCLDLVSGFSNVPASVCKLEDDLIHGADLIVTSSQPLADRLGVRPRHIIRNGAEVDHFAGIRHLESRRGKGSRRKHAPTIGYFGAISDWFEFDWIVDCARRRPDWRFELIGLVSGCDVSEARTLTNIALLGEKPYAELPAHLASWDAAIIPFKLTELIECTNPVKLYEYMAGGKPVVASAMPEVVEASSLVYIARDGRDFGRQIERALTEDGVKLRQKRQRWARSHHWDSRALAFRQALDELTPLVSIIVLCHDNWTHTRACLESLVFASDYDNLEIIVVDNGSTDKTAAQLKKFAARDRRLRIIRNGANLGFAAGNNRGILAAKGDYLILLNNDTYVTRGWVRDLIRPLRLDGSIGLAGPLTNSIGNEQKVVINYRNMQEMSAEALKLTRQFARRRLPAKNLAFFCVAMSRRIIEEVGLLDEEFGLGFFEDDDYCRRVEKAGYKMVIVDDVFVHHHLSASFDRIGAERKQAQMARNKLIYETKWGPWQPHRYRNESGFG